jgi:hypothetical protein
VVPALDPKTPIYATGFTMQVLLIALMIFRWLFLFSSLFQLLHETVIFCSIPSFRTTSVDWCNSRLFWFSFSWSRGVSKSITYQQKADYAPSACAPASLLAPSKLSQSESHIPFPIAVGLFWDVKMEPFSTQVTGRSVHSPPIWPSKKHYYRPYAIMNPGCISLWDIKQTS